MTNRLRRSELAVPASNPKLVEKAAGSDADLVFLDLEDATAPATKEGARQIAIDGLNELDWGRTLRAVRVNDHETEWAVYDMVRILEGAGDQLDIIIIPKVKRPSDLLFFETMLLSLERKLKIRKPIGLEVLIEEAEGLGNVEEIARCSERLEALILGFGDLAASMGMRFGHELDKSYKYPGDIWNAHRVRLIAACRAAGIDAIDGPFGNFKDDEGYRAQCTYAAALGAVGKWCIHPAQIPHANAVFAPTEKELKVAQKMVAAYAASVEAGSGAAGAGGSLVDAATERLYRPVIDRARQIGMIE